MNANVIVAATVEVNINIVCISNVDVVVNITKYYTDFNWNVKNDVDVNL